MASSVEGNGAPSQVSQEILSLEEDLEKVRRRIEGLEEHIRVDVREELRRELIGIRKKVRKLKSIDLTDSEEKSLSNSEAILKTLEDRVRREGPDAWSWIFVCVFAAVLAMIVYWGGILEFSRTGVGLKLLLAALLVSFITFIFLTMIANVKVRTVRLWRRDEKKEVELAVPLAVLFGYLIIGAGIGGALIVMNQFQPTTLSGWSSASVEDGEFSIRLQAPSNLGVSPLQTRNVSVEVLVGLIFDGGAEPSLVGNATVTITGMDTPLSPSYPEPPLLRLNDTVRAGAILLNFTPTAPVDSEVIYIHYEARYNISAGSVGAFEGSEIGSLSLCLKGSEFSSGWHLLFIFAGILTSFWWRVANHYLRQDGLPPLWRSRGRQQVAKFLLLPFFSLVIALAVFRQFQESLTVAIDPLVSATAGYVYGFFWESASQKFGKTVLAVTEDRESARGF